MEVIGRGFGRTGTLSTKKALERLGFGPCHHMFEAIEHPSQFDTLAAHLRGEPVDWRGCDLSRQCSLTAVVACCRAR